MDDSMCFCTVQEVAQGFNNTVGLVCTAAEVSAEC